MKETGKFHFLKVNQIRYILFCDGKDMWLRLKLESKIYDLINS